MAFATVLSTVYFNKTQAERENRKIEIDAWSASRAGSKDVLLELSKRVANCHDSLMELDATRGELEEAKKGGAKKPGAKKAGKRFETATRATEAQITSLHLWVNQKGALFPTDEMDNWAQIYLILAVRVKELITSPKHTGETWRGVPPGSHKTFADMLENNFTTEECFSKALRSAIRRQINTPGTRLPHLETTQIYANTSDGLVSSVGVDGDSFDEQKFAKGEF